MKISFSSYWRLLAKYLKPEWPRAWLLAMLVLGNIALQLFNPQIVRTFIDTALARGASEALLRAALLFIGVALVQQAVSVLATYVSENVGWRATNALRTDLAGHCLRLDMSFHTAHTPGEMTERIDGDVTALSNFFSQFVIQVIGNGLLVVGVLALLFREDWRAGLPLAVFALLTLLVLAGLRGLATSHWEVERQASAELFGFLEERLAGTEDIRSCGAIAYVMRCFYGLMRQWMNKSLKAGLLSSVMINSTALLLTVGPVTGLAVGAYLFQQGVFTIGTVYLTFYYSGLLTIPINNITLQMQDLQRAGASVSRVQKLLGTPNRIQERGKDGLTLPGHALAVEFQGVSFGYQVSQPAAGAAKGVLHDLSFRLPPGRALGLLGRTGSGKTTLARLLFRFYDPDQGCIRLGATSAGLTDIRDLPLTELRRRVGLVTQDIQLFHASVRDNLTFFDRNISDDRILQVVRELGLGTWTESLPQGLDTVLESGGGGLSAGEAQLLAFVRVFLGDPGLVILDEASSRLDPATEHLIECAVDRLLQNRTAIVIAHRLGTVQRADEIMILEEGRIGEVGPRAALAGDPASRFYQLLQTGMEEVLA